MNNTIQLKKKQTNTRRLIEDGLITELHTDGSLILITSFNTITSEALNQLSNTYNPPILQNGDVRKYVFYIENADENSWTVPDRMMGSVYDGFFGFYGDVITLPHADTQFELLSGNFINIPTLPKIVIDLWVTMFCDLVIQTYRNKQIKTIDKSPTQQLDYEDIVIPFLFRQWENEPITHDKIHALNLNNDEVELTFGRVTYDARFQVLSSVFVRLIKLGYSETDIFNICKEYNFYAGDFSYRFANQYESALVYIADHKITKTVQELYGLRFKYWNDHLVYSALLSLALQNFTMSPSVTNTQLRRMTGIVGHNSIVVSLERLIGIGLIRKELLKSSKNDAGYFQIYKYHISPKIDTKQYVDSFDGVSALLLHHQKLRHVKQVFNTVTEELNAQKVIGKSYLFIPLLLEVGKLTPKAISEKLDIGYSISRDYVKKLFDLEVLQREKNGRVTMYYMSDNYYDILHELMVAHLVKNTTKINAEISQYELLKTQRKAFNDTKDEYVKDGTLETKLRELGNDDLRSV